MPCREALELGPAHPRGGERALAAAGLELGGGRNDFRPGGGGLFGVQAGGLEGVLVVIEHRRRAVERERQHLAVGGRVVAGHGGNVGLRVELLAAFLHDVGHGLDGALGVHHGGGAHFEHLQDVRCVAGAEGGNAGGHGLVVFALVGGDDLVVLLAFVELLGQVVDPVVQGAIHRMPPLDFSLGLGENWHHQRGGQRRSDGERLEAHEENS